MALESLGTVRLGDVPILRTVPLHGKSSIFSPLLLTTPISPDSSAAIHDGTIFDLLKFNVYARARARPCRKKDRHGRNDTGTDAVTVQHFSKMGRSILVFLVSLIFFFPPSYPAMQRKTRGSVQRAEVACRGLHLHSKAEKVENDHGEDYELASAGFS